MDKGASILPEDGVFKVVDVKGSVLDRVLTSVERLGLGAMICFTLYELLSALA